MRCRIPIPTYSFAPTDGTKMQNQRYREMSTWNFIYLFQICHPLPGGPLRIGDAYSYRRLTSLPVEILVQTASLRTGIYIILRLDIVENMLDNMIHTLNREN